MKIRIRKNREFWVNVLIIVNCVAMLFAFIANAQLEDESRETIFRISDRAVAFKAAYDLKQGLHSWAFSPDKRDK